MNLTELYKSAKYDIISYMRVEKIDNANLIKTAFKGRSEDSYFVQLAKSLFDNPVPDTFEKCKEDNNYESMMGSRNTPLSSFSTDPIPLTEPDTHLNKLNIRDAYINTLSDGLGIKRATSEDLYRDLLKINDRSYHNINHCENMLINLERYLETDRFNLTNPPLFKLAVFTHDRFTGTPDDIDNSIKYAVNILNQSDDKNIKNKSQKNMLERLIRATDHSKKLPNYTRDEKLISDLDLLVLASEPKDYKEYTNAVRKEYEHIGSVEFNKGRLKVLKSFLKKESIFKLPFFIQRYENTAKYNILNEIKGIKLTLKL